VDIQEVTRSYDFSGRTVVLTGGTGVLGQQMVRALLGCGANVALLARDPSRADAIFGASPSGTGLLITVRGDVLEIESLKAARAKVVESFGSVDALVNAAGGNDPRATTSAERAFFDIPQDALRAVLDLNLLGTILPTQVFGSLMAQQGAGVILNISSMAGLRPLTRVGGYSAAKAAVGNFTQWLAVHVAQEYSPAIRVNAIAPGFFLTEQNRFLLAERDTGELTERGRKIIAHTPMGRFGEPGDLVGCMLWLLSPLSAFVTGVVLPVDGGYAAYGGV
jgi:NAD(P)-dependent dehydrogenase (short-subunit alcohol dehydrogenase family)